MLYGSLILDAAPVSIYIAETKRGALFPAEVILGEGALALLCQHCLHSSTTADCLSIGTSVNSTTTSITSK